MRLLAIVVTLLAAGACAPLSDKLGPGKELEGVRDFVVASELQEVNQIRMNEQLKFLYVNDYYVIVPTRRGDYLLEFRGRCTELRRLRWTSDMVDFRIHSRILYSDFDTIRGCKIGKIFPLTEDQLEELRVLGDAPGNEEFIPDQS